MASFVLEVSAQSQLSDVGHVPSIVRTAFSDFMDAKEGCPGHQTLKIAIGVKGIDIILLV